MDFGMSIVKFIIFAFNLLFALGGLALIVLGALVQTQMKFVTDVMKDYKFTAPAIVLIVVGSIIFIIAFLGCCGAAKESHCMLITYSVLLSSIFLVEIVIAILAFVYRKDTEQALENAMRDIFESYENNKEDKVIVDAMQSTLQCCGINGKSEYQSIPPSCCGKDTGNCTRSEAYSKGCLNTLKDFVTWSGNALGGVAIGVAAIELVGIIFSCCLASTIRNEERRGRV